MSPKVMGVGHKASSLVLKKLTAKNLNEEKLDRLLDADQSEYKGIR
jgi:hypothetical protein